MRRNAARTFVLIISLAAPGCVHAPRTSGDNDDAAARQTANESPALKPKEGLTFRPRSFTDGANVDPVYDDTGYESSDGETVTWKHYRFRRPESAAEFYSKELARARAVLATGTRGDTPGNNDWRRAVVEFEAGDGRSVAAVLQLRASYVHEIVGPSAGHVLAFEQSQGANW